MSLMDGREKVGIGSGENEFRYRRSAIREHFTDVFGITNNRQFDGSWQGEKKPDPIREAIMAVVSAVNTLPSAGYLEAALRRVRDRESGTKRVHTQGGMGNDPLLPKPLEAKTRDGRSTWNRKG